MAKPPSKPGAPANLPAAQKAEAHAAATRGVVRDRFSTSVNQRVVAMLQELEKDIVAKLSAFDPDNSAQRIARLKKLQKEVAIEIKDRFDKIAKEATGELSDLAGDEARWKALSLKKTFNAVGITADVALAPTSILEALIKQPVVLGGIAADYWEKEGAALSAKFAQQMQIGVAGGESISDLIKRVRGSKAANFSDGMMSVSRRNAESLTRTSVNSIANAAHMEVYKQNADVVEGVQHYSVLDSRTTVICSSRHGLKWKLEDRSPVGHSVKFQSPPLHWRCRSIIVSVLDMETPPVEPSFDEWFNGMTKAEQDDLFGGGRAKLWRENRISQSDLLSTTGRPLTLAELRAAYDQADPSLVSVVNAMKPVQTITPAMKAKNGKLLNKMIADLETSYSDAAKQAVDEAIAKAIAQPAFFTKGAAKKAEKALADTMAKVSSQPKKFNPADFGLPALPKGSVPLATKAKNASDFDSFIAAKVKGGAWQQYGNDVAAQLGEYLEKAGASKLVSAKQGAKLIAAGSKLKAKATGLQPIVSPYVPKPSAAPYVPQPIQTARQRLVSEATDYLKQPNIPVEFAGMKPDDLADLADKWGITHAQTIGAKNGLSAFENRAINHYTGSAYRGINTDLRGARTDERTLYAKVINGSLSRMKAPPAPAELFRGVGSAKDIRWDQATRSMQGGLVMRADGINSFSTQTHTAASFGGKGGSVNGQSVRGFIWKTKTTKSARVIANVSSHSSEAEWLFADGTYFRATAVEIPTTGPFRGYAVVTVEELASLPKGAIVEQAKVFGLGNGKAKAGGAVVGKRVARGAVRTARQEATDYTVAGMNKTGFEHAAVIDDKGRTIWKGTSKQTDSVGIGGLNKLKPGQYAEIHHSHPVDQSFSVEDLLLTSRAGRTNVYIYAHTPQGGRFKARAIRSLSSIEDSATMSTLVAKSGIRQAIPSISSDELEQFSWHFTMLALKREGYIQYAASLSARHRALIATMGPEAVERVVAATAKAIKSGFM